MFWIEGIARCSSGLVLETITPKTGRELRKTTELWQKPTFTGGTTTLLKTSCAHWKRESGRMFWEKLGIQGVKPKDCQGIFSVDVGTETYLIPASAFIQSMMRPLEKIHHFLFKPQGLESFCTPILGNDKPNLGIVQPIRSLFNSHNHILPTWFTAVYSWMSCFPSANNMWASVYQSAVSGHLDIVLPEASLTLTITSVKHENVNLATELLLWTIETNEKPYPFAHNHTQKIELHQNAQITPGKTELLPRGNLWTLTDDEWLVISTIVTRGKSIKYEMREIINLILLKLGTGCPWRKLTFGNLNFPIVQNTYHRLSKNGNLEEAIKILNRMRAYDKSTPGTHEI
jgi:pentatricopeptide repeat protein